MHDRVKMALTQDGMIQQILCICASVDRSDVKSLCVLPNDIWSKYPLSTLILLLYPPNLGFSSRCGLSMFVPLSNWYPLTGLHVHQSPYWWAELKLMEQFNSLGGLASESDIVLCYARCSKPWSWLHKWPDVEGQQETYYNRLCNNKAFWLPNWLLLINYLFPFWVLAVVKNQ